MKKSLPMIMFAMLALLAASFVCVRAGAGETKKEDSVLSFKMKSIDGKEVDLSQYKGKVVMIVNTASKCGFTPQYKDLEALYKKYQDKNFVILGFPANNFGHQEPGTDKQIAEFCKENFDVTFPMFSKISVKGEDQAPLYKTLTSFSGDAGDVKWNFEKFLIGKDGKIVARYRSKVTPSADQVINAVEAEIAK